MVRDESLVAQHFSSRTVPPHPGGRIEGILPVREVREGDPVAQYLGKMSTAYMRACRRRRVR